MWLGSSESSLFGFLTWEREMETETEVRRGGSSLMSLPIWAIIPSGAPPLQPNWPPKALRHKAIPLSVRVSAYEF